MSGPSLAQPAPSLRQAVEAAWSLSPQARALASRQAELEARARAASSLIAGPPSLSLGHRTDRVGSNGGLRESEFEVTAPLWTPGVRRATADQVEADRASFEQQQALAKMKLAAEVRELAAQAAIAQIEREVAQSKLREAQVLAGDVERRVKVGEVARVDLLQAQSVQRQAAAAQAQAQSAQARSLAQWRALTGLAQSASLDEQAGSAQEHPAVTAAQAQLRAAQAKLAWTQADHRDPVEVGVGMVRERAAFGAPNETSLKLSLRVPLGSHGRNAPKLAAAQAEVYAAEAEAQATVRSVDAEQEATRAELAAAQRAEALAAERETASREVQALIAKSYRLGESDLPTRLRAESERFEAELAHAKARLETRRAIAKLNQANGILP
ncbi:TolC family protein [Ramlibacter sp. WS9]|uniref:TolC family protein n=1 Tax=Ramlibacter sp. WS9 TaxID=1882741 RepID=UPI0013051F12|nr:TolC family protein [Ramlibacter sp. WS9]